MCLLVIVVLVAAVLTIVLVTNLIQQARRMADQLVFLNASRLVECGPADEVFNQPREVLTSRYLEGAIG